MDSRIIELPITEKIMKTEIKFTKADESSFCGDESNIYTFDEVALFSKNDARTPIKRGCSNKECFCTGKCNEIIGWRDNPHD